MGNRLLLADDSITIQKVVAIIFANQDYELTIVDNGGAALTKAGEILPDIMLVDASMPGMSGYDVCEAVRNDPVLKHTPLLLMTGAFEVVDEEKAGAGGADDFISKPFESQVLVDKVQALIEKGKARKAAAASQEPPPALSAPEAPEGDLWRLETVYEVPQVEIEATAAVNSEETASEALFPLMEDIVEATPEDDPWGALDFAEIVEEAHSETVEVSDVIPEQSGEESAVFTEDAGFPEFGEGTSQPEEKTAETAGFFVDETDFTLADIPAVEPELAAFEVETFFTEEEPGITAGGATATLTEPADEGRIWEAVEEQTLSFRDEEEQSASSPQEDSFGIISMDAAVSDFFAEAVEPLAHPVELPAEGLPPQEERRIPSSTPLEEAGQAAAMPPAQAASPAALSDEQLKSLISSVSREVIEKVVWEVVPDLAERLIREEIRKIKEGS